MPWLGTAMHTMQWGNPSLLCVCKKAIKISPYDFWLLVYSGRYTDQTGMMETEWSVSQVIDLNLRILKIFVWMSVAYSQLRKFWKSSRNLDRGGWNGIEENGILILLWSCNRLSRVKPSNLMNIWNMPLSMDLRVTGEMYNFNTLTSWITQNCWNHRIAQIWIITSYIHKNLLYE